MIGTKYVRLAKRVAKKLSDSDHPNDRGYRSLGRALGVGHTTLSRRINNPETVKLEQLYALQYLDERMQ